MRPKTPDPDESDVLCQGRDGYFLGIDKPSQPQPLATLHSPSTATGRDVLALRA